MLRNIFQIRGQFVNFYLIAWDNDLVLIDGGFISDFPRLEKQLKAINKTFTDISLILLTHGHIDHTANISKIKKLSGAQVLGHPADKLHIAGKYPYTGNSKICGTLETIGRALINYQPFQLDAELHDNQHIDIASGIRVIHLPGHTAGHCGFYHEPTEILFTGDFYQYDWYRQGLAPFFLNSCPEQFAASIKKVLKLNPKGIYSNHSDRAKPELQYERFGKFVTRFIANS
jgi:glyoxylase-like metal-dependent hydrolase (beta-lactamase superfamily II)